MSDSIADIRPEARRNFHKLVLHILVDWSAYFSFNPVLYLLIYQETGSYELIAYCGIAYGLTNAVIVFAFGALQNRIHQLTSVRLTMCCGVISCVTCAFATAFPSSWALDIIGIGSVGVYYGFLQITAATIVCDSIDPTNPDDDLNFQYMVEIATPIFACTIIMIMFAALGDEWSMMSMQIIIGCGLAVQFLAQGILFSLRDLRMTPAPEMEFGEQTKETAAVASVEHNKLPDEDTPDAKLDSVVPFEEVHKEKPSDAVVLTAVDDLDHAHVQDKPVSTAACPAPTHEKASKHETTPPQRWWLAASFVIPSCCALAIFLHGANDYLCFSYFSYYATSDLGLSPLQYFGYWMAQQGSALILAFVAGKIAAFVSPTKFIPLFQMVAAVAQWYLPLGRDTYGPLPFVVSVAVHGAFRDSVAGLMRGVLIKYSTPSARVFWNGMGVEGARYSAAVIGLGIGGAVTEKEGFPAVLWPSTILATLACALTLPFFFAPPIDDSNLSAEEKRDLELAAKDMGHMLRARHQQIRNNFRTYLALLRAKRLFLRLIHKRRERHHHEACTVNPLE